MRTALSTAIAALGLALSVWLAVLKIWALPCLGGNCAAIVQSSYGSCFGLPVGVYGAALWLGVFFARDQHLRLACLGVLALGSVVFVGLQVFVLKALCPFCLAHALASWSAFALGRFPPRRWGLLAAIAAIAAGTAATFALAHRPPAASRDALSAFVRGQPDGLYWLGARGAGSPVLVLSLTCPACLDTLSALTQFDFSHHPTGPALYFKTDPSQRALTSVFVAAILARPGNPREALLAITTLVLPQRDLLLTDPNGAAQVLRALLPEAAAHEPEAAALLVRQAQRLQEAKIETTPLLIAPDGAARAFFKLDDVFR